MCRSHVSPLRMYLLRAMYLLIVIGNALTVAPSIIAPATSVADAHSVVHSMLGALMLLSLWGLRYPLLMLPILLWELVWKSLWMFNFASRMWLAGGLDEYAKGVAVAVTLGLVLTPLVLPWGYIAQRYLRQPAESWQAWTKGEASHGE